MQWLSDVFSGAQSWLFDAAVQPLMFWLGMAGLLEDGYAATGWFLVGAVQLVVLVAVIGPLQRWRPVEPVTDRATVRTDMIYTLIHRLGVFRLALFFTLDPVFDALFGALRSAGYGTFHLDQVWPGVTDNALVSLLIYLLVFDFVAYWTHRGQHQIEWWWRLHALHHAQRQMTMWSDNRNHLLDDVLVDVTIVLLAQLIGVAPGQFVAIVALTQLSESFQHANIRLWFGRVGERLWVSPRFHRLHHSIGLGHEWPVKPAVNGAASAGAMPSRGTGFAGLQATAPSGGSATHAVASVGAMPSRGTGFAGLQATAPSGGSAAHAVASVGAALGGSNFGVLLPWWDMLFGTANFEQRYDPTGIRDQLEAQRDYGRGFWSQQWMGIRRLVGKA